MIRTLLKSVIFSFFFLCSVSSFAYKTYDFEVSYIYVTNNPGTLSKVCRIGMKNVTNMRPAAGDANICDNQEHDEIWIADCETPQAQNMMAIAMAAKLSKVTAYHTAISHKSLVNGVCSVNAYNIGLVD